MAKKNEIIVKDVVIRTMTKDGIDYICITDIAKQKNETDPNGVIGNWMRNRNTVEFLGIWETLNNSDFNPLEFEGFRKEAGLNAFTLSPSRWIEATNAIGIISQSGRYGGTYAVSDMAFEFASWISVEFRLYLVKEFQRLKAKEQELIGWTAKRELSKINYRIHTDAIKQNLIPEEVTALQASIIYAEEADVLNVRHVSRSTPSGTATIAQVNNYYPFGGLLKEGEHHWDIQNRFYNGKEYDRMQGLNLYDYSARQYDPAVCQFTSIDPLCEKYYHISPYIYCGGNPVKYVDPDGRDAVSIIDEENKIITIKADYYVQTADRVSCIELSGSKVCKGYNADDIKTMNGYSEMLNDMDLKVTEGEYEGYSIRFDLSFIDGGTENDCIEKASNDTFDGVSIGNTFSRWDETHKQFRIKENGDQTGGFTSDNNFILMNKKLDTKMNRMHELFHTFGFEHPGDPTKYKGIMKYPPQRPNTQSSHLQWKILQKNMG